MSFIYNQATVAVAYNVPQLHLDLATFLLEN
ncbi:hypothetical protein D918_01695 [Trichuris suis]|nr:hypothetical protein D918_01695 [Trichuris suis]